VGKLVVLDLFAEVKPIWTTSEQFYGVPYIWKVIFHHIFINKNRVNCTPFHERSLDYTLL